MLVGISSPKFDIYQGKVATDCLRVTQTLDILIFFKKIIKVLSNSPSKIHLDQRNVVFTRQPVRSSLKIISRSDNEAIY